MSEFLGIPHTSRSEPWLTVPDARRVARVVFHRSPRYRNPAFRWDRVYERYARDPVFVGYEAEYADSRASVGAVPTSPPPTTSNWRG